MITNANNFEPPKRLIRLVFAVIFTQIISLSSLAQATETFPAGSFIIMGDASQNVANGLKLWSDGSISLTIAGGATPNHIVYTAPVASPQGLIQPAQVNGQNFTLLMPGTYSVTLTDTNGCSKTSSVTLTNISTSPVQLPVIRTY